MADKEKIQSNLFKEARKYPLLSIEDEVYHATNYSTTGCLKSREILINSNILFVVQTARKYRTDDVNMDDLVAAGMIGLTKAVDRFEVTKGFKLISYAVAWIKAEILLEIQNNKEIIRVPLNKQRRINAGEYEYNTKVVRWDTPVSTDDTLNQTIGDTIGYEDKPFEIQRKTDKEKKTEFWEIVKNTFKKDFHYDMVMAKYGGDTKITNNDIAEMSGTTKQNISQHQRNCMKFMRNNPELRRLYEQMILGKD